MCVEKSTVFFIVKLAHKLLQNSLGPDQTWKKMLGPRMDPDQLILFLYFLKKCFEKKSADADNQIKLTFS